MCLIHIHKSCCFKLHSETYMYNIQWMWRPNLPSWSSQICLKEPVCSYQIFRYDIVHKIVLRARSKDAHYTMIVDAAEKTSKMNIVCSYASSPNFPEKNFGGTSCFTRGLSVLVCQFKINYVRYCLLLRNDSVKMGEILHIACPAYAHEAHNFFQL